MGSQPPLPKRMLSLSFQTSPNCSRLVSDCWRVRIGSDWTSSFCGFSVYFLCSTSPALASRHVSLFTLCPPFLSPLFCCLCYSCTLGSFLSVSTTSNSPVSCHPSPPPATVDGKQLGHYSPALYGYKWALEWSWHHSYHVFLSSPSLAPLRAHLSPSPLLGRPG